MRSVLDNLPDETEPTVGDEIGRALIPIIEAQGHQHQSLMAALTSIISSAQPADPTVLRETQFIVHPMEEFWRSHRLEFTIERHPNELAHKIIAEAKPK